RDPGRGERGTRGARDRDQRPPAPRRATGASRVPRHVAGARDGFASRAKRGARDAPRDVGAPVRPVAQGALRRVPRFPARSSARATSFVGTPRDGTWNSRTRSSLTIRLPSIVSVTLAGS